MTITIAHLTGNNEPISESIRYKVAEFFEKSNTNDIQPKFLSEFGSGRLPANLNKPLKANDFILKKDEPAIIFREGGTVTLAQDNTFVLRETTVFIDIFGTPELQYLIKAELDRLFFEDPKYSVNESPDGISFPKSVSEEGGETMRSSIIAIKQNVVDWIKIGAIKEAGTEQQYSGQIDCQWQITKT